MEGRHRHGPFDRGDLDATRVAICKNATVPIGTVPIYSMIIGRKIEDLNYDIIMETCKLQAEHGVSYFTIHAGILKDHVKLAKNRLIGLVSRGGSLLAKWMIHHGKENPFNTAGKTSAASCASTTSPSPSETAADRVA